MVEIDQILKHASKCLDTNKMRQGLSIVLLVCSIFFTLSYVFVGFGNPMDPYYWIMQFRDYSANFMTCGTAFIGHLISLIFGEKLVMFRLFSWLLVSLSVILPYCILLDKEKQKQGVIYLAIGFFFLGYGTFAEFSPGTMTVFLTSLLVIVWSKFIQKPSIGKIILLSTFSAMAIICRFPSILIIPVMILILCIDAFVQERPFKQSIWHVFVYVFCVLLLTIIGYWILGANIYNLSHTLSVAQSDTHSIYEMITALWKELPRLLMYLAVIITIVSAHKACLTKIPEYIKWVWVVLLSIGFALFYKQYVGYKVWYNSQMHEFLACISIALLLRLIMFHEITKEQRIELIGILLLCVMVPMGSDTVWMKLFPVFVCLLPYLAANYIHLSYNCKYLFVIGIVLSYFVLRAYVCNPIGNVKMWQNQCTIENIPIYKGIFVSQADKDRVDNYMGLSKAYSGENNIAFGNDAVLFGYLTNTPIPNEIQRFFFDEKDVTQINSVNQYVLHNYPNTIFYMADFSGGKSCAVDSIMYADGYEKCVDIQYGHIYKLVNDYE